MITKRINGKLADLFFLDDKWNLVDQSKATLVKAVFRNGERKFYVPKQWKPKTTGK
jgi:hypothetical protein